MWRAGGTDGLGFQLALRYSTTVYLYVSLPSTCSQAYLSILLFLFSLLPLYYRLASLGSQYHLDSPLIYSPCVEYSNRLENHGAFKISFTNNTSLNFQKRHRAFSRETSILRVLNVVRYKQFTAKQCTERIRYTLRASGLTWGFKKSLMNLNMDVGGHRISKHLVNCPFLTLKMN